MHLGSEAATRVCAVSQVTVMKKKKKNTKLSSHDNENKQNHSFSNTGATHMTGTFENRFKTISIIKFAMKVKACVLTGP